MKKLFAVGLVSIFLLHFAGLYTYFGLRLITIRQEMRQLLKATPTEKLELITLSKAQYNTSLRDDDELELHGNMYDIARVEVHDDIYFVYALHDDAEDNLLGFLDEVLKRSSSDKKSIPSQLLQFFSLNFIAPQIQFNFPKAVAQKFSTNFSMLPYSHFRSIDSPPPQG